MNKILASRLTDLPGVVQELASCVYTDMTMKDMALLATDFHGKELTVFSAMCPGYTAWDDGVSYVYPMFDEWQGIMRRVDAGLDPNDETVVIPEPWASNQELGAASNSPAPRDYDALVAESNLVLE